MNITIKTIPVNEMRYSTVGDWWFDKKGNLEIRVADLKDWRYEAIIAIHELVEVVLCKHAGISQKDVDDFDMSKYGLSLEEPGMDSKAPYHLQHVIAINIEEKLYGDLDMNVDDFEDRMGEVLDKYVG